MTKIDNPDAMRPLETPAEQKRLADAAHPFILGLANAGAILGRDIGVLALRSIESQSDADLRAVLVWTADRIPAAIAKELSDEMKVGLHSVMLVPVGASMPSFNFADQKVRSATRMLIDGSKLYVFEKVEGLQSDDSAA